MRCTLVEDKTAKFLFQNLEGTIPRKVSSFLLRSIALLDALAFIRIIMTIIVTLVNITVGKVTSKID